MLTSIETSENDTKKYAVDSKRYVLVVFNEGSNFDTGSLDVTVEFGDDFLEEGEPNDDYKVVGEVLSTLGEEYFGYSQARDILQGLYGAI